MSSPRKPRQLQRMQQAASPSSLPFSTILCPFDLFILLLPYEAVKKRLFPAIRINYFLFHSYKEIAFGLQIPKGYFF
jgi:hypothetical protein